MGACRVLPDGAAQPWGQPIEPTVPWGAVAADGAQEAPRLLRFSPRGGHGGGARRRRPAGRSVAMVAMAATAATPSMSIDGTTGTSIAAAAAAAAARRESHSGGGRRVSSSFFCILLLVRSDGLLLVCILSTETYCVLCTTYVVTSMIDYSHFHTISVSKLHRIHSIKNLRYRKHNI